MGKNLPMFAAAWQTIGLVLLIAGGALGLFWSTTAFERWLDDGGSGESGPIEPAIVEGEPAPIGEPRAA